MSLTTASTQQRKTIQVYGSSINTEGKEPNRVVYTTNSSLIFFLGKDNIISIFPRGLGCSNELLHTSCTLLGSTTSISSNFVVSPRVILFTTPHEQMSYVHGLHRCTGFVPCHTLPPLADDPTTPGLCKQNRKRRWRIFPTASCAETGTSDGTRWP